MKLFIIYTVAIIIAIGITFAIPTFSAKENVATTLYTITGIMFSIGLSMTVTSSTSNIKNQKIKKKIRTEIKSVRNKFIVAFTFASLFFIYYITAPFKIPSINNGWLLICTQLAAILFFIVNFISIQRFNEKIEDSTDL